MEATRGKLCVTGAGGFLGSWVVQLLLSRNYFVNGTVRDPSDEKYAHLYKLDQASDNLKLFKADLLNYEANYSAIQGCDGVLHVATHIPYFTVMQNPEVEVIEPAVKGTLNVLKACVEAKVKRVLVVSSMVAVTMNPSWPKGRVMDESCWSDKEYCKTSKDVYPLAKTEAESEAIEFAKQNGLHLVTVCPTLVLGPMLQSTKNASSKVLINLLKGEDESVENTHWAIVDVRDVAEALILAYEKPEAEGRYICTAHAARRSEMVEKLRNLYPNYNYPKNFTNGGEEQWLSSEKLQRLGWSYRSLEQTLVDSVESYRNSGILD